MAFRALLIFGSATIAFGCGPKPAAETNNAEAKHRIMTESSRNLTVSMSENGRPSYVFTAPLVEGYTLGSEPYREFREGVEIITFEEDSLAKESGRLKSKYAIYYEKSKLWEAVGDVEVYNNQGRELYTQQLFWNATAKRIYSNVETKIVDKNSGDIYIGEGFESDEEMNNWKFRKLTGRMSMELENTGAQDLEANETKPDAATTEAEKETIENSDPATNQPVTQEPNTHNEPEKTSEKQE